MITELKKTPITINGKDYLEVLVQDDTCPSNHCCDLCYYRDYEPSIDLLATCCDVHSCGQRWDTYYIIQ